MININSDFPTSFTISLEDKDDADVLYSMLLVANDCVALQRWKEKIQPLLNKLKSLGAKEL